MRRGVGGLGIGQARRTTVQWGYSAVGTGQWMVISVIVVAAVVSCVPCDRDI